MSIVLMSRVWGLDMPNPGRKLVLLALCDCAGDTGLCWPSVRTLQRKCSMSERAVRDHLRGLEAMGLIDTIERHGTSSHYQLNQKAFFAPTPAEIAPRTLKNPKEPKLRERRGRKTAPEVADPMNGFNEFWEAYPRKVSKQEAEKAWAKLQPDEHIRGLIMSAVNLAKTQEQWRRDEGRFIPHASTWLNQRRWKDEIAAPAIPMNRPALTGYSAVSQETKSSANARNVEVKDGNAKRSKFAELYGEFVAESVA